MLNRAVFLYGLFVVAAVSTGTAIWQALETNLRQEQLAEASQQLTSARNELRAFKEKAEVSEKRVRVLEASVANGSNGDEKLRAELAAARQQLGAAETAIRETEDRLADEVAAHAQLKVKAEELTNEVAAAGRAVADADANSATSAATKPEKEAVVGSTDSDSTGSLADPAAAEPSGTEPAAVVNPNAVVKAKKAQTRKSRKQPVVRAVKPIGTPFEPLL